MVCVRVPSENKIPFWEEQTVLDVQFLFAGELRVLAYCLICVWSSEYMRNAFRKSESATKKNCNTCRIDGPAGSGFDIPAVQVTITIK